MLNLFMQENIHLFLTKANGKHQAIENIKNFLDKYQLVRYDFFEIDETSIIEASSDNFWEVLELGLKENKEILLRFLVELKNEGYSKLEDILELPQGYLSKILHLIAHLVDGFFGIDSAFYNLIEDSHFLSEALRRKIRENPDEFYLLKVKAYIKEPLYKFELLSPKSFFKK